MKNLFIIDVYNLIYRMFYAIPEINTRAGKPVNAVFGVAKFLKSLWENGETHHLVVANDAPGKNIRNSLYAEYKGTRERMPDNLRSQIEDVFALFRALHIPILEQECYEADDIIGSIVCHIKNKDKNGVDWADFQAVIISSDKDLCQFVEDGKIHIFDAMKQKFMRRSDVIEKFSIPPEQVVDYLAIVGDSSDNIPGIAGFGPKKAEDLLGKYGSLEGIYEHLDDISEKLRNTLIEQKEKAFLSQSLAKIHCNLSVSLDLESSAFASRDFWTEEVIAFFQLMEFKSLLPTAFHAEVKKFEVQGVESIDSLEKLSSLIRKLTNTQELIIATDKENIVLSSSDTCYRIEPRKVDVGSFLEFLEKSDIRIVGYNVKEDLKNMFRYKKSLQGGGEGQMGLF